MDYRIISDRLKELLGLKNEAVGLKLIQDNT